MKRILFSLLVGITLSLPSVAAQNVAYGELVDNLDLRKNTKLHVTEYWKTVRGSEVTWSGEVVDVKGGSSKVKLYVADKSRPLYKGYNIIVTSSDASKAANLKKGQRVRFKGVLDDYSAKKPGAVIEVVEAQLL